MRLLLDGPERFDCHGCGQCCRADWKIPVEPERVEGLQRWPEALAKNPSGAWQLRRLEAGCSLLCADSRCAAHARLGASAKPLACRTFPFVLTPTPAGTQVSLSYFCPSVRQGRGRPLVEHAAELERLVEEADLALTLTGPFRVSGEVTTGWEGYRIWEEELLWRLTRPDWRAQLRAAWQGLAERAQDWGRVELEELFPVAPEDVQPGDPRTPQYLSSLVRGKLLLRRSSLLDGLALLSSLADDLRGADDWDRRVEQLELGWTHGRFELE